MKKGKIAAILILSMSMLTGCIDYMPDMTEEQSELVAEYAANLLLKYSSNYNYRLADEEELAQAQTEEESMQTEAETETVEQTDEQEAGDSEETSEELSEQETESDQEDMIKDGAEYNLAELFGLDNMTIYYNSCEVVDSYPKAEAGSAFSVTAPKGYNLLILHFDMENTGTETKECDLFDQINKIKVNVNNSGYTEALNTLLTNDFATYMEEIPAGENRESVIAVAVTQENIEEIDSINIRVLTDNSLVDMKLK